MKVYVVLFLIAFVMSQVLAETDLEEEWKNYKTKFNKNYEGEVDQARKKIFMNNMEKIKKHNEKYHKGDVSYSMGINQFTDSTTDELHHLHGLKMPDKKE